MQSKLGACWGETCLSVTEKHTAWRVVSAQVWHSNSLKPRCFVMLPNKALKYFLTRHRR